VTEQHTDAVAVDLGRPAGADHGDAAYWARIRRVVDQAPPLSNSQRARIRAAFFQPVDRQEKAA
jgi:hypothetical protein